MTMPPAGRIVEALGFDPTKVAGFKMIAGVDGYDRTHPIIEIRSTVIHKEGDVNQLVTELRSYRLVPADGPLEFVCPRCKANGDRECPCCLGDGWLVAELNTRRGTGVH